MTKQLLWTSVVVGLVLVLGAFGIWALADDDDNPPTTPTSQSAAVTPTPIPVVFESSDGKGTNMGWRMLGPRPESVFPPWHGTNAIIYDTQSGTTIDLGPGSGVAFSPDGKHAAWLRGVAPGPPAVRVEAEALIVTPATGNQRAIGRANAVMFPDNDRVALGNVVDSRTEWKLFDIDDLQPSADQTTPGGDPPERRTSTGHILKYEPVAGTELPRGWHGTFHYQLFDPDDGHLIMEFDAFEVADATETELVVASAWTEIPTEPFVSGPVQLYLLDVTSGQAKWLASARASTINFKLTANDRYVLWTNDFCSQASTPEVVLYDRVAGVAQTVMRQDQDGQPVLPEPGSDEAYLYVVPSGLIAEGTFGATALIDPVTLEYVAVLPKVQLTPELQGKGPVQPTWSNDYRYAAYWQGGGHGGLC